VPGIFKDLPTKEKLKAAVVVLAIAVMWYVFFREAEPPVVTEDDIPSADAPSAVAPEIAESVPSADIRVIPRSRVAEDADGTLIVIDKSDFTMEVFRDGKTVGQYGIAAGKNTGDKRIVGDLRTPEGEFPIVQIQDASKWTHDFGDGNGQTKGAYGPYFIRLGTPGWSGIGIHGTHAPGSIGTNVTEGCIRLRNEDVQTLRNMVKVGDKVVIRR
jgi:lipoprotein-anchoring transpeptidase ErfK/SrfK